MKRAIHCLLPLFPLLAGNGHARGDEELAKQWARDDMTNEERDALVEKTLKEPFEVVIPLLYRVLARLRAEKDKDFPIAYNPWGEIPWHDEHACPAAKTEFMVGHVWSALMKPENDPAKARFLISLLDKETDEEKIVSLLVNIDYHQWIPEAEDAVHGLAADPARSPHVRFCAAHALLMHLDLNANVPLALEVIRAHKAGLNREQYFPWLFNFGNRLYTLTDPNRRAVLRAGFAILVEASHRPPSGGYFVARFLGFLLKPPREFAPDQTDEKYKGAHGLKDTFFEDTVCNALAWWATHKDDPEMADPPQESPK